MTAILETRQIYARVRTNLLDAIYKHLEDNDCLIGSPVEIFKQLNRMYSKDYPALFWPQSVKSFGRQLRELEELLKEEGICCISANWSHVGHILPNDVRAQKGFIGGAEKLIIITRNPEKYGMKGCYLE